MFEELAKELYSDECHFCDLHRPLDESGLCSDCEDKGCVECMTPKTNYCVHCGSCYCDCKCCSIISTTVGVVVE